VDDLPIIDAHHHLWDLEASPVRYPWLQDPEPHPFFLGDYSAFRHTYLPPDYRRDAGHHNVVATVHVEAECDRSQQVPETEWLVGVNRRWGMPNAIVAHAWFHTPDAEAILAQQAGFPLVRGIRSKPVTAAKPTDPFPDGAGSMHDPNWLAGYRLLHKYGLSWDLRVPCWHLEEAARVVADNPETPVVLNHTGFPWDRSPEGLAMWRRGMQAVAKLPNVMCKLSCLCLPDGPWTEAANRPIVLETIELFGTERCMFASNFPVDRVRIGYEAMFDAFKRIVAGCTDEERRRLFHDNAKRFYRIG